MKQKIALFVVVALSLLIGFLISYAVHKPQADLAKYQTQVIEQINRNSAERDQMLREAGK